MLLHCLPNHRLAATISIELRSAPFLHIQYRFILNLTLFVIVILSASDFTSDNIASVFYDSVYYYCIVTAALDFCLCIQQLSVLL